MGVTSEGACNMPEHMKRREAIYYFRRVLPIDLQTSLGRREICRSLKTSDFAEAKRRLHIESVRFDEWVRAEREKLANMRQMVPANENAGPSALADAMEEYSREADAFFTELHGHDDDGLTFDQWRDHREQLDRQASAEFFADERRNRTVALAALFEDYAKSSRLAVATKKQWRAVVDHLISFLGHDNAARLRAPDLRKWRDHLAVEHSPRGEPRKAKTINDSYLAPVRAMLAWALDRDLLTENVAASVKPLRADKDAVLRERNLTKQEQAIILRGTLAAPPANLSRHKAAARRWVPWLCAYTGARVGEITQARSEDVTKTDGVWTLKITPEAGAVKTNRARVVPLHDHLIEQGFLEFVASCDGPMFYRPRLEANHEARAPYKLAANRLAEWVRQLGVTDVPQPNHSWRHTFKTLSRTVGIQEGAADYIQGHAPANDSRAYGSHDLPTLAGEIAKLPRFTTD
jgi:integrase